MQNDPDSRYMCGSTKHLLRANNQSAIQDRLLKSDTETDHTLI